MSIRRQIVAWGLATAFAVNLAMGQLPLLQVDVDGETVSVTGTAQSVNPTAVSAAGGYTFDLFLDSTADILLIEATLTVDHGSIFESKIEGGEDEVRIRYGNSDRIRSGLGRGPIGFYIRDR